MSTFIYYVICYSTGQEHTEENNGTNAETNDASNR